MTHKSNPNSRSSGPYQMPNDPPAHPAEGTDAAGAGTRPADPAGGAGQDSAAFSADAGPVAHLETELADQRDKYLRLAAEYDNFRKRAVRERQDAEQRGMSQVMRGLLDALDDLGRFAHVDPATVDASTVVQGADMVEKKLLKSLAGHGLEVVNPVGAPFDPALHEAVATTRAELPEEDHRVAQVYQVGYLLNGQLLRPARVVVTQWHAEP